MKLAFLTTLALPMASSVSSESYLRKAIHQLFATEQLASIGTTPCTYFSVDNDEGCGTDDMCKIATGNCMLMSASQEGVCITPPEMCTYDFNPVCGCDGVSYSNECDALGSGVNVMNVGCCPDDEDCEDNIEDSFTSADETTTPCTYFNVKDDEGCGADDMCKIAMGHCMAIFMVASLEGVCITPPERCTYNFDPVCGCDNVTYGNECSAFGAGVNIQFPGCCLNDEECQTKLA